MVILACCRYEVFLGSPLRRACCHVPGSLMGVVKRLLAKIASQFAWGLRGPLNVFKIDLQLTVLLWNLSGTVSTCKGSERSGFRPNKPDQVRGKINRPPCFSFLVYFLLVKSSLTVIYLHRWTRLYCFLGSTMGWISIS